MTSILEPKAVGPGSEAFAHDVYLGIKADSPSTFSEGQDLKEVRLFF